MAEVDEVQERMKVDMEAMKEQMVTMMEAIMSMKKIMEVNAVAVAIVSAISGVDPTPSSGLNLINHPTADTGDPHFVLVQNKQVFPPYGLPPNYTPTNENVNNSTPILIESQQPQSDHAHVSQPMGETHEMPHHNLADFEPCLGYATEGQAVGGIPLQKTLEGPQYHPQPHPMHSTADTLPVFYYEKMVGYAPSSFADLVFAGERIEAGLKRGKFDCPALMNDKIGANEEDENEKRTHVVAAIPTWPNFPLAQQCHRSANIGPSHYPPPSHPQRPSLNHPQSLLAAHPMPRANQNTNQEMNLAAKKPVEFTPIPVSYADLLLYLLDNSMVAITPAKVPQPPYFRGYDSNAICAYHGGASGHSIEHCRTLKHKVQGLIDAGWLKFEENRL
ncbi:hypothetical protein GmHk_12G035075 [Glycine max]|nr:hypothetical protein GmHk_12G035075 [Glycine max]